MNEDLMLLQISIAQALDELSVEDRTMVALYYQLDMPEVYADYDGPWPTTFTSVADYIGRRFGDGPLAESTIRYRMQQVLQAWRRSGAFAR